MRKVRSAPAGLLGETQRGFERMINSLRDDDHNEAADLILHMREVISHCAGSHGMTTKCDECWRLDFSRPGWTDFDRVRYEVFKAEQNKLRKDYQDD